MAADSREFGPIGWIQKKNGKSWRKKCFGGNYSLITGSQEPGDLFRNPVYWFAGKQELGGSSASRRLPEQNPHLATCLWQVASFFGFKARGWWSSPGCWLAPPALPETRPSSLERWEVGGRSKKPHLCHPWRLAQTGAGVGLNPGLRQWN